MLRYVEEVVAQKCHIGVVLEYMYFSKDQVRSSYDILVVFRTRTDVHVVRQNTLFQTFNQLYFCVSFSKV